MYNSQRNFYLVTTSCCRAENFPPTGYGWNRATFSQPILPPAQGRWPMWTDTQPQKSKQTTLPASLQDGGPSLPTVYSFQRGLGGKYRPQRCLPYSSSAEVTSEVPPVPLEVNDLPIQGNTFLLAQIPWDQDHCISGRHAPGSFQQATSEGSDQHDNLPTSSPGLQSELGEVIGNSPPNLRISRDRNRFSPNGDYGHPNIGQSSLQNPVAREMAALSAC